MATSGTITGTASKGFKLKIEWERTSFSIANNTSTILAKLYVYNDSNAYNLNSNSAYYTIDGTKTFAKFQFTTKNTWHLLGSKTITISHNSNGTKTYTLSGNWYSGITSSAYTPSSLSVSGSITLDTIPRYATSNQSLKSRTETSITMNWSSDNIVDYVWFSIDNGKSWAGVNVTDGKSGSYTISGLSPNRSYQIKTRVRRKDSQLTTDSSILGVMTYNYPYCTDTPNFTLGDAVTLKFYNPLNRAFQFYIIANGKQIASEYRCSGTSYTGINDASGDVDQLYQTIPNAQSGAYQVKVVYGTSTLTRNNGNTFKVRGNEIPSINDWWYADTNPETLDIIGNNLHIVQNHSNLSVTYQEAKGNKHASISKYTFELNGVKKESTSKGGTVDFGKVNSATDLTLTMTVTDSRGLTALSYTTVKMLAHSNPTALVTLERLNNYEDESYLTIDGSVSSVNGKNTMEIKYRYKESGGTYNSFVIVGDREKQTFESLDKNKSFIFNVVITDAFGSTHNREYALGKGVFPLFIDTALNSIGINKLPTKPKALEIDGEIILEGDTGWLDVPISSSLNYGNEFGVLKARIYLGVLYIKGDIVGVGANWSWIGRLPEELRKVTFPHRFAVVYDMTYFCGMLIKDDGNLYVTKNGTGTWDTSLQISINNAICI